MAGTKGKKKTTPPQSKPADDETNVISDLTAELNEHVFQGRIFDARSVALKLQRVKNEVKDASDRAKIESVEHVIEEVIEQSEHVKNLLQDLHSDDGWILAKEGKGVKIHYRREEGTSIHTVRAQTQFHNFQPKDFCRLCSLFVETECMPQWFPGRVLKDATVLSWHSKYSKVVQLHIGLDLIPFLSMRDAILYGNGFHLPDRNAFLIRSKSTLDDTCRYCDIPPPAKGVVRMMTESIFYVQLLQKDVIEFKMIGRDDLKLKYVPSPLLNYIAQGHMPYDLMRNIKRAIVNFEGSVWDKKMKERGAYYKEIEDKVYVQLEKWDKEGAGSDQHYSYETNMSKEARLPTKQLLSTRNMLPVVIVIMLTAISTPLLAEHRSMLNEMMFASISVVVKLLENEHFRRIISSTPTLMLSLASIQKVIKLLSNDKKLLARDS